MYTAATLPHTCILITCMRRSPYTDIIIVLLNLQIYN